MKLHLFTLSFLFISTISFGQTLEINDGFKQDLIGFGVDLDGDGEIQQVEADQVDSLEVGRNNLDIYDLSEISYFKNLRKLHIWAVNDVETLDVSELKKLESLSTFEWTVTNIVAHDLENLKSLTGSAGLMGVSLDGTLNLETIGLGHNWAIIPDLPYTNYTKLKNLQLYGIPEMQELNLDGCISLETLTLNLIVESEVGFEALTIKNGRHTDISLSRWSEGTFKYICTDEEEEGYVRSLLAEKDYNSIEVNSYCSFNKGGQLKKVSGESRIDYDGDGCDLSDPVMPILRYEVTDHNTGESEIRTSYNENGYDGRYEFRAKPGTYRIKPLIDNPTYFTIFPEMQEITIEDYESDAYLDFCIEPIEDKHDVSIGLYPITRARPGFSTTYWLGFSNEGTTMAEGEISLKFDNDHIQFASASEEAESLDHGEMIWSYDNLQPGEFRYIKVEFVLNKPTENEFPLMGDEKLTFDLEINSVDLDIQPHNNIFQLKQTVVNSHDPNDITCLEGDSISFLETGEFVHYMVRFENTGTAEAVNIVIKDTINTNKFDLESLIPMEGSHPYKTRIKSNGVVEFIFENINLPFTEEEKHGHVLFKIKTKESLIEGDQFANSAAIYFDYNFPIFTNEFETQVVGAVLPVRLTSFDANQNESSVDLNWIVQSEENLSHYVVERRYESEEEFDEVSRVNAKQVSSYNVTDKEITLDGTYFYKLRIVDNDGSSQYSDVIALNFEAQASELISIYPNPATEYLIIENNNSAQLPIYIVNSAGQEVLHMVVPEQTTKQIDLSNFARGLHFVSYIKNDKAAVQKIIIDK